jgi:hypothetical protein
MSALLLVSHGILLITLAVTTHSNYRLGNYRFALTVAFLAGVVFMQFIMGMIL